MSDVLVQLRRAATLEVVTTVPARRALAVLAFALLTAFSAHASVPLPGTPVPVSLQTLAVLMSGMLLGPALGATAMMLYLAAGAAGLPVFAMGMGLPYLFGPTGGYLLAFPAAAAIAGAGAMWARGGGAQRTAFLLLAATLATVVVYAGGWSQLSLLTGDAALAFRAGVLPFLVGDVAKIVVAAILTTRLRPRALALL
jgi:biotin transport system substrate-specific component